LDTCETLDFSDWTERIEELATRGGLSLPLDLSVFRAQYHAGETPIEALENYATGHGTL